MQWALPLNLVRCVLARAIVDRPPRSRSYPRWFTSRPLALATDVPFQYKYAIISAQSGAVLRMENIEGERIVFPSGACNAWAAGGRTDGRGQRWLVAESVRSRFCFLY